MVGPLMFSLYFYPRSPCGERRRRSVKLFRQNYISIHALLAESDRVLEVTRNAHTDFYPRSPCGERLVDTVKLANAVLFLSTLSLRRATTPEYTVYNTVLFLSTLSLRRATGAEPARVGFFADFYPRSPCGERRPGRRHRGNP